MAARRFFSSGEKRGQSVAFRRQHPDQPVDAVRAVAQFGHPGVIDRPLLTVEQVQAKLGLSTPKAVYNLTYSASHPLPVRRVGRYLRFDEREVNEWTLRDRQVEPQALRVVGR